jgi:hypothetical protein
MRYAGLDNCPVRAPRLRFNDVDARATWVFHRAFKLGYAGYPKLRDDRLVGLARQLQTPQLQPRIPALRKERGRDVLHIVIFL